MPSAGAKDDDSIEDAARLLRRIEPHQFIYDGNLERYRPTSAAFGDHPDGSPMSVQLADVLAGLGLSEESVLFGHDGFLMASIKARLARQQEQGIYRLPQENEPARAEVFGKKTKGVSRAFSKAAEWVVPPPAMT
jgi:hypothetical protein